MSYNTTTNKYEYDFEMPEHLNETEIAAILPRIDDLVSWCGDVKEYALQQALTGTQYEGYKVVEGRANRKYVNEEAVASAVKDAGYDPYEKKLLGITAMTSLLGKKKFNELVGSLVEKPKGKPGRPRKVVKVEDEKPKKRPGRPRKEETETVAKKRPGRPKKEGWRSSRTATWAPLP